MLLVQTLFVFMAHPRITIFFHGNNKRVSQHFTKMHEKTATMVFNRVQNILLLAGNLFSVFLSITVCNLCFTVIPADEKKYKFTITVNVP